MGRSRTVRAGLLASALVVLGCGAAAVPVESRPEAAAPAGGCAELYESVVVAATRLEAIRAGMDAEPALYYAVADAMTSLGRHLDRPFAPARVDAVAGEYREAAGAVAVAATRAGDLLAEAQARARAADDPSGPARTYQDAVSRLVALCSGSPPPEGCREAADVLLELGEGSATAARTERVRARLSTIRLTSQDLGATLAEVDAALSGIAETLAYAEGLSARSAEAEIELSRASARFLGLDTRADAVCQGQPI